MGHARHQRRARRALSQVMLKHRAAISQDAAVFAKDQEAAARLRKRQAWLRGIARGGVIAIALVALVAMVLLLAVGCTTNNEGTVSYGMCGQTDGGKLLDSMAAVTPEVGSDDVDAGADGRADGAPGMPVPDGGDSGAPSDGGRGGGAASDPPGLCVGEPTWERCLDPDAGPAFYRCAVAAECVHPRFGFTCHVCCPGQRRCP